MGVCHNMKTQILPQRLNETVVSKKFFVEIN